MKFRKFFSLILISFSISIFATREQDSSCTHVYSPFELYLGYLHRNGCQLINERTGEFIYKFDMDDYGSIRSLIDEAKTEHTLIQIKFSKVNGHDGIILKPTNTNAFTFKKVSQKDIEFIRESYLPFSTKKQYKITINGEEYIFFVSEKIHDYIQKNRDIPTFLINENACKDPDKIMPYIQDESGFIKIDIVKLTDMV